MGRSQEPDVFGKVSQHQEEKVHSEVATNLSPGNICKAYWKGTS